MQNFIFRNPTKLIFGKDPIAAISNEIPKDAKIMITYGGGSIKKNRVYDRVKNALKGYNTIEFGGIEPNPKYETLMKAVELGKSNNIDYLLAVGGGSVIDGTKFIAVALNYDGDDAWQLVVNQKLPAQCKATPLSTVLTLPATGSEMNCGAVISKIDGAEKFGIYHTDNYPRFSILDPEVCFSLPARQIANGLVDTYVHVLEQYLTSPKNGRVNDRFAESLLSNVIELAAVKDRISKDYDLASDFMLSATMALNGIIGMGATQDWATHRIGHELTALCGLDHAVTLAIVGPSLMNVMREEKREKLLQYASRIWGIECDCDDKKIDMAIEKTRELYESVGIKTRLRSYGISDETIEEIANRFHTRGTLLGENQTIDANIVRRILMDAK